MPHTSTGGGELQSIFRIFLDMLRTTIPFMFTI